ncbi:hypothetical protein L6452_40697 [Arctium lappa]|uniref:Uncharacterized protein n=1 Tax=Arctium lappa TaxID=4217 RepID=A0ACB8XMM7_ARCLA|nr:hypothetical protein L6452_40697 [Arctium lappa]
MERLRHCHKEFVITEVLKIHWELHHTKMKEDQFVGSHLETMRMHLHYLEKLGYPYHDKLAKSAILGSLNKRFNGFEVNLKEFSISELCMLLETYERNLSEFSDFKC